jgi:SAM-dependent methyltransferase
MLLSKKLKNALRYGVGAGAKRRKKSLKLKERASAFQARFRPGEAALVSRGYATYEAYIAHQASKLDAVIGRLREVEADDYAEFIRRFSACVPLRSTRTILCLGARLGTEVRALHALGHFAVGVDVNPGGNNAYVLPGDFHCIQFPDGSADGVYTNALDHVFDLPRLVGEVVRVLRPGGLFVVDVVAGYEEGHLPGNWEAMHRARIEDVAAALAVAGGFDGVESRDLGHFRDGSYRQLVLRKPLSGVVLPESGGGVELASA